MTKFLILAILCLTGCGYDVNSVPPSPTGNSADAHRFVNLAVKPEWHDVLVTSIKYVTQRLKHPEHAVIDGDPVITAYYDKDKTTSWLQLTGHAHSFSPTGTVSHQTFVVGWSQDGNAATNKNINWDFQSLDVVNDDPSDHSY